MSQTEASQVHGADGQVLSNKKIHQIFNDQKIARQMCYMLAQYGFMRGVLDSKQRHQVFVDVHDENAPFNVHHIRPISLGGTNDFSNLTLMDVKLHSFVHRSFFSSEAIEKIKDLQGTQADLSYDKITPVFPPIATLQNCFLTAIFYATKSLISLGMEHKLEYVKTFFYTYNRHRFDFSREKFDNLIKRLKDSKDVPWNEKDKKIEPVKNHFLPVMLSDELLKIKRTRETWLRVTQRMTEEDVRACQLIRTRTVRPETIIRHGDLQKITSLKRDYQYS